MGYRSEVVSVVYGNEKAFTEYVALEKLKPDNIFVLCAEYITHKVIDYESKLKILTLEASDVKWYGDYPTVISWNRFMEESVDHGLNYEFARVGEEDGDVETSLGGDDLEYYLRVQSSIIDDSPIASSQMGNTAQK